MRVAIVSGVYPRYAADFYRRRVFLRRKTFAEQRTAICQDSFGWADNWSRSLEPLGYDVLDILYNVPPLQQAWARENGVSGDKRADLQEIAILQAEKFQPHILWFDDEDEEFLGRLRSRIRSLKLVVGWAGSALSETRVWNRMDIVLSCAPESVLRLNGLGHRAVHLHHAFDPAINTRLRNRPKKHQVTFAGSLMKGSGYHDFREAFLCKVADEIRPSIFCPETEVSKALLNAASRMRLPLPLTTIGRIDACLGRMLTERILQKPRAGRFSGSPLRPYIRPGVFGLEMFQCLKDSEVVLNIHADSSPRFASNMRLFEATGVGSCLVTEDKENLQELFDPDREVVIYRTAEECVEKIRWLLDHPREREEIAQAGHRRTLRDHTFENRARRLDEILQSEMRKS